MEELNDVFHDDLFAVPFELDGTGGFSPHLRLDKQPDDVGPCEERRGGGDDLAPLGGLYESLWEADEGAEETGLARSRPPAFAPVQPEAPLANRGTTELPPREELQRQAARFASLATALTMEAYARASTPLHPGSPASALGVANSPPAPRRHASSNNGKNEEGGGVSVSASPCLPPASPSHSSEERVSQSDTSPLPPPARKKPSGKARRRPRNFLSSSSANDGTSQCHGYNSKKRARCQNPALMDCVGPRPEFCAEHIHLDPDALYGKCGAPSGRHNMPCKEVVLKEFRCCHKHIGAILRRDLVGRGALERTKRKKQRAEAICQLIERDADDARVNSERFQYQRKRKLLPKYRALAGVLAEHQAFLERL